MNKFRHLILPAFVLILSPLLFGQNYTTVTATKIQYANQQLIPKGTLCFQATDQNDAPISFQVGGGGQVVTSPVCVAVVNGVSGTLSLPNPANTTPANILYRITANDTSRTVYTCRGAQLSGASFNFDTFACQNAPYPAPGGVVQGPLTVNGNINVQSCTGCGTSSAGYTKFLPNETPDGSNEVFHFPSQAASDIKFQLFWNGLVMNEIDDYTITIGGGQTTVTCVRPPKTGDKLFAYF